MDTCCCCCGWWRFETERKKSRLDDVECAFLCRPLDPSPGPNIDFDGKGCASSFCTSMGMSPSPVPGSSSYLHLFLGRSPSRSPSTPDAAGVGKLPSGAKRATSFPPVRSFAFDHCSLVLASKNPLLRVRVCLCNRYLASPPEGVRMLMSTSPECEKTGNSFCCA